MCGVWRQGHGLPLPLHYLRGLQGERAHATVMPDGSAVFIYPDSSRPCPGFLPQDHPEEPPPFLLL